MSGFLELYGHALTQSSTCLYPRRDPDTACGYAHTATCKHCRGPIHRSDNTTTRDWIHSDGDHARLHTCPVNPYGFHAEPIGTPCGNHPANPCNGARGIEVRTS